MDKFKNLLWLRLTIMLKHKSFWILFVLITSLIMGLVIQLYIQVDKGILIPVGIVDEDKSSFSEYVIQELETNPLVEITVVEKKIVESLVKQQIFEAVYIIKKGAQDKVMKGQIEDLFEVVYLDENYFTMMLTDILSGDFLDEICIMIAGRYYDQGIKEQVDTSHQDLVYNEVYEEGRKIETKDRKNYFIDINVVGDESTTMVSYDQSIVLEKMLIGIVYIFIAFFILFEGLHILEDRRSFVYQKMQITGISLVHIILAELVSLMVAGFLISIPLSLVTVFNRGNLLFVFYLNGLFVVGMSGFVYLLLHLIKGINSYILVGTSVIISMGIVSGSFFAIDVSQPLIRFVAQLFPTYYSVLAYFDKAIIREYSIYTTIYVVLLTGLCYSIDRKRIRSKS